MKLDPNAPAFPVECDYVDGVPRGRQTQMRSGYETGLTVRQHIVVEMAKGMIAKYSYSEETVAILACKQADALIAELNKEQA